MANTPEPEDEEVAPLYHYPVITPCDLCDTKENVNSFCRNCSQNLCDVCKRSHLRSRVSSDHNVVHISEGRSSEFETTACAKHGERLFFYCRTCSVLFCPKCLNQSHKSHDFLDTDECAKELQNKVTAVIHEKSKEVEESGRNILHIEEKKQSFADSFTNCKTSVINAAKLLHSEVDRVQTELLSTISHHESQCLAKFDEVKQEEKSAEKELQRSLDNLLHHSKKHDNISLIAHASKIIDDAQAKTKKDITELEPGSVKDIPSFRVPIVDFKAMQFPKITISQLFGTLHIQHADIQRKHIAESTKGLQELQTEQQDKTEILKEPEKGKESKFCSCKVRHNQFARYENKCRFCEKQLY